MSAKNESEKAIDLSQEGQRLLAAGEYGKAVELLKEAARIYGQEGDLQAQASSQIQAADVYLLTNHHQQALENYQNALNLLEKLENTEKQAGVLSNIGLIEAGMGRNNDALAHFRRSLALFEGLGSTLNMARQWGNLGTTYRNMQDYERALDAYNHALPLYQELNHTLGIADQFTNMAYIYTMRHEMVQALEFYKKTLPLYTEAGDSRKEALTRQNIDILQTALEEKA